MTGPLASPTDATPIRLIVVDDQPLVRAGIRGLLDDEPDIEVVAEAADGATAIAATRAHRPDVVLMDLQMPGIGGVEATKVILEDAPTTRVLVLTTFDDDELVLDAIRGGASGYVLKGIDPTDLADAVRATADGQASLSPTITRSLVDAVAATAPPDDDAVRRIEALTPRELEIVTDAAQGRTNAEIAELRSLSVATVRTHIGRAMLKVDARDRAQLVVIAHRAGLA